MHPNVEGYGVVSEGETYHPSAFFDPAQKFAEAGTVPTVEEALEKAEEVKSTTTQDVNGVPSNPTEITAEQSNADLATSRVHPDVPNVNVEFTAQPSVVVTKVEEGEPVELKAVTNVVGIEPNGEAPEVTSTKPAELLSDKDAETIERERQNKREADYQTLQDSEDNVQHPEQPANSEVEDENEDQVKLPESDVKSDDEVKFS